MSGDSIISEIDIFQAVRNGDVDLVVKILEKKGELINSSDGESWQPIHIASQLGNLEMVKELLSKGANPHAVKQDGSTPLHDAAYSGSADVCKVFLDLNVAIDAPDEDGWTPLHYAAAQGNQDAFKLLIESQADLTAVEKEGKTVFQLAHSQGQHDIVELLKQYTDISEERGQVRDASLRKISKLEEVLHEIEKHNEELRSELEDNHEKDTAAARQAAKTLEEIKREKKRKQQAEATKLITDQLDGALEIFLRNTNALEQLIKETELEIQNITTDGDPTEQYAIETLRNYTLSADDIKVELPTKFPEGEPYVVIPGTYFGSRVQCVLLLDVSYHEYFESKLAHHIAQLSSIAHPYISQFIGVAFLNEQPEGPVLGGVGICIVYESCVDQLSNWMSKGINLSPREVVNMMSQLSSAVSYLHSKGLVHLAIDSTTIMIDEENQLKLGLVGILGICNIFQKRRLTRPSRTYYAAPESLPYDPHAKNKSKQPSVITHKADIYSLGMTLISLSTLMEKSGKSAEQVKSIPWDIFRPLATNMIKTKPEDRPTSENVLSELTNIRAWVERN